MLRGGFTLSIGWIVMILVPIIMGLWFRFKKDDESSQGPYTDGKLSRGNKIILAVCFGIVAVIVIWAAIFTPIG